MRFAVVGHTEWVQFARVAAMPVAGQIVHSSDDWEEAAGGGPVTAVQLARLGAEVEFHTALGDDELGQRAAEQFRAQGLTCRIQWRGEPTRRAFTHVDAGGERTITVVGEKLRPRGPLHFAADGCCFVAGDAAALRCARDVRFLAATARELATIREAGVKLDLRVGSANDPGEQIDGNVEAAHVVRTDGSAGGTVDGVPYAAAPLPGPLADAYGCGDSFAAALAFALARGDELDDALDLATRAGAAVLAGRGPYAAQLTG
jgi:ribokinase